MIIIVLYFINSERRDCMVEHVCLQILNREYLAKLEEVGELQAKCVKGISHQKYRMAIISKSLKQ